MAAGVAAVLKAIDELSVNIVALADGRQDACVRSIAALKDTTETQSGQVD